MNKYQEAIKWFEKYIDNECYKESFQNACKLAIESIEKATPKKVVNVKSVEDWDVLFIAGECPVCGSWLNDEMKYCPECGQRLEWE